MRWSSKAACSLLGLLLPLLLAAQTPCTDTLVRLRDTVCEGETYFFGGRQITYGGVYYDTLPRHASDCDSVLILTLSVLPQVMVQFTVQNICRGDTGYRLLVGSDGSYFRWRADPPDSALAALSRENPGLRSPLVNPQQPTTYYVYADYAPRRVCPDSGRVSVTPLVPVTAALHVDPAEVSVDHLELTLVDQSSGNRESVWGYGGRQWHVGGRQINRWGETERLRIALPASDSLRVTLMAYSYTCGDSAVAMLPVRREGLYFPNAFEPGAGGALPTVARFAPVAVGVAECEIWIYDRRGCLMHHAVDARQGWDGRCGGADCPQGVYVYRCRYRETAYPASDLIRIGTLLLLR